MKVTEKELKKVVAELNDKICDPSIKTKDPEKMKKKILQAAKLIEKGDDISKETMTVIKALSGGKKKKETKAVEVEKGKKGKPKTTAKAKSNGVGVIATIQKIITDKATSKDGILKQLVKKFPDRIEEAMKKTINAQLPNRMMREKGIKIVEEDGKFFAKGKA